MEIRQSLRPICYSSPSSGSDLDPLTVGFVTVRFQDPKIPPRPDGFASSADYAAVVGIDHMHPWVSRSAYCACAWSLEPR